MMNDADVTRTELSVTTNDQTLSDPVESNTTYNADPEAVPNIGHASTPGPVSSREKSTPRFTLSIALGRAKPSIPDYKGAMMNDTTFAAKTIPLSQLKDMVKRNNYTFWHFKNNYRIGSNFAYSTDIILDFDGDSGLSIEEGIECAKSMKCYVLLGTSYSHMRDKKKQDGTVVNGPCFRILIPTCRLFHSWSDFYSAINFVNSTYFHRKAGK